MHGSGYATSPTFLQEGHFCSNSVTTRKNPKHRTRSTDCEAKPATQGTKRPIEDTTTGKQMENDGGETASTMLCPNATFTRQQPLTDSFVDSRQYVFCIMQRTSAPSGRPTVPTPAAAELVHATWTLLWRSRNNIAPGAGHWNCRWLGRSTTEPGWWRPTEWSAVSTRTVRRVSSLFSLTLGVNTGKLSSSLTRRNCLQSTQNKAENYLTDVRGAKCSPPRLSACASNRTRASLAFTKKRSNQDRRRLPPRLSEHWSQAPPLSNCATDPAQPQARCTANVSLACPKRGEASNAPFNWCAYAATQEKHKKHHLESDYRRC